MLFPFVVILHFDNLKINKKSRFHETDYQVGARDENRTHTSCDIRPSNVRVYQFRHLRISKLLDYFKKNRNKRQEYNDFF